MESDLVTFGEGLAKLDLTETSLAVALIWYRVYHDRTAEVPVAALAADIHDLSLRDRINKTRLAKNLIGHPDVVRGKRPLTFKIKLSRMDALTEKYEPLLKRKTLKVVDHIIPASDFEGTRSYLESIVHQVNGTYQFQFFDACIVMCRRLVEILLIEAFEQTGKGGVIRDSSGNYQALSDIIAAAKSGHHIRLGRTTGKDLDQIKEAGDAGAHSRTYITKPHDIDDLKLKLRRVVSELAELAKVKPRP